VPRGRSSARAATRVRAMEHMHSQRLLQTAERVLRRREVGPLLGLGVLILIFGTMSSNLFTRQQVGGITSLTASIGTVAIGVTFLMIAGEFDLSVGAVFALSGVLFGKFLSDYGIDPWLGLILALAVAACIGLANGVVTTWFGIPSFITTLAALLVVQGVDVVITGGNTILFFGNSKVLSTLGGTIPGSTVQYRVLWFVGLTALLWFVLERTKYGNWTAAVGGRAGVARAMGVPTRRVKTLNFVVCSALAGFAGIMQFAAYGAVSAQDGTDYNLLAIVAAVIGGTSLFGVTGTVLGAFVGAFILGLLQAGLILIGVGGSWYTPLIGVILVVAVIVNVRLSNLNLQGALARFMLRPSHLGEDPATPAITAGRSRGD
jgi:simple sugar transport system permease protein